MLVTLLQISPKSVTFDQSLHNVTTYLLKVQLCLVRRAKRMLCIREETMTTQSRVAAWSSPITATRSSKSNLPENNDAEQ